MAPQCANRFRTPKGDEHIIIAVIDTGVDLDHPDLRRRITNGYNVLLNNNFPDDDNGHGTHVAGIIASETNNHEGLTKKLWAMQALLFTGTYRSWGPNLPV